MTQCWFNILFNSGLFFVVVFYSSFSWLSQSCIPGPAENTTQQFCLLQQFLSPVCSCVSMFTVVCPYLGHVFLWKIMFFGGMILRCLFICASLNIRVILQLKLTPFVSLDCGSINNPSSSVQVWLIDAVTGKDIQIMMYSRHATYPEFLFYYHLAFKPLKMCFGE